LNFILIEGKISPEVARARLWFNQQSESKAASASSLDVFAVSKKKNNGSEENRRKLRVPPWNQAATLAPRFVFVEVRFFLSFCPLLTTA